MRTKIHHLDKDFKDFAIALYGNVQENVHSADMEEREVWRFRLDDEGKHLLDEHNQPQLELATGLVTILPKVEVANGIGQ